jgi:hypothetical protein
MVRSENSSQSWIHPRGYFKLPPPGSLLSIFYAQGSPFITLLYINQYVADTVQ